MTFLPEWVLISGSREVKANAQRPKREKRPAELVARIAAASRHPRRHDAQDARRCAHAARSFAERDAGQRYVAARRGREKGRASERPEETAILGLSRFFARLLR